MILAPLSDPILRAAVRRAALPEEDVLHKMDDVKGALRLGFPRLLVYQPEDRFLEGEIHSWETHLPTLALTRPTVNGWQSAWRAQGLAVSHIDDSALRLRSLMLGASRGPTWVEGIFADLTLMLGRGLPQNLRGFARRVMEYPARYSSLGDLQEVTDLSSGALKARFRRRGLPSPVVYLRWFRLAAASRLLSEMGQTTLMASYRMGFSSDGNFCRWVRSVGQLPPAALRAREGRMHLLLRLGRECFPKGAMEGWGTLGDLFLRDVA
jgi:AraC-like DNA-binding protein